MRNIVHERVEDQAEMSATGDTTDKAHQAFKQGFKHVVEAARGYFRAAFWSAPRDVQHQQQENNPDQHGTHKGIRQTNIQEWQIVTGGVLLTRQLNDRYDRRNPKRDKNTRQEHE